MPNSSTGSAGALADNRLSPTSATPQKPLRSAGSATQNDGSTPEGWPLPTRNSQGESRPPVELSPRESGVSAVSLRLGRRAASVYACKRLRDGTGTRRGGQSKASGSGTWRHRGRTGARPSGRAPGIKPRDTRSPSLPQLGCQLPSPVRSLRHWSPVHSFFSFGAVLVLSSPCWSMTCHCHYIGDNVLSLHR